jgi:hypothetical protein
MKSVFAQTFRNPWLVGFIHVGLWALLVLSVTSFGGKSPVYQESTAVSNPLQNPIPVSKLPNLFSPYIGPASLESTNALNPFFTRHFIPPATPPAPAPTTRKIELTYQGFYEPVGGPKHVIVKLADAFLDKTVGANLTANLYAANATMQGLTLTNSAAQTNLLLLNTKKEIEVPIK